MDWSTMRRDPALFAIVVGGSIAGALDITYAIVFSWFRSGVLPARILQSVASGLLGARAYDGGIATAALGLLLHFFIAFVIATVFFAASRKFAWLVDHAFVSGIIYGALVYGVMNLIVLPLSAYPRRATFPLVVLATGLFVHMFFIGLPIALATRKASTKM
ncbi:MAG: hypothetical protein DMF61_25375 [Blastocatellia bacterium AA13]|nr:MAG: hypothetical protein DMF61_25375 [Blastocatellia bacterium AA13]